MSEGAHAPKPWCASADADVHIQGDERKIIAWCAEPHSIQNARLIAAAPDMLTALQEIQSDMQHRIRENCSHSTLIRKDLAEKISAAIGKATGTASQEIGASKPKLQTYEF